MEKLQLYPRLGKTVEFQRQCDISSGGEGGDQIEKLVDIADPATAKQRPLAL